MSLGRRPSRLSEGRAGGTHRAAGRAQARVAAWPPHSPRTCLCHFSNYGLGCAAPVLALRSAAQPSGPLPRGLGAPRHEHPVLGARGTCSRTCWRRCLFQAASLFQIPSSGPLSIHILHVLCGSRWVIYLLLGSCQFPWNFQTCHRGNDVFSCNCFSPLIPRPCNDAEPCGGRRAAQRQKGEALHPEATPFPPDVLASRKFGRNTDTDRH